MNLTGQKLIGGLSAAGAVMALLFAGNRCLALAAQEPPPQVAEVETMAEKPTQATEQTQPERTETEPEETAPPQTQPPRDLRGEALSAAAETMAAEHIFVYDTASGEMLCCTSDPGDKMYPASITKLFSAWVALKYLEPDAVVTAGDELGLVQSGSSTAYIRKGCRLTVEMLIEAMLLPSGNDGAYVLAAAAGRAAAGDETLDGQTAVAVFVDAMNREAQRLGFRNSFFVNPDGYHHSDHVSCPEDVVRIGALALAEPVIAKYTSMQQDSVVFESGQWITWYNTNSLLNPESKYYVPACRGLKTGYTGEAGYCLLAAFAREEGYILIGIFGGESKYDRYADAQTLLELCT